MRKIILFLGCVWGAVACAAPMSDMVCAAMAHAPHVVQIRGAADIASAQVAQARAALLPTLSLQATRAQTEATLSTVSDSTQLRASWSLVNRQAWAGLAQAEHLNRAAGLGVQLELDQFAETVVLRHLQVLRARTSVQVAQSQVEHWRHMQEVAKGLKEVGRAIGLDEQRAAASWAQAEATLAEARQSQRWAEAQFRLVSPFAVDGPDLSELEQWVRRLALDAPAMLRLTDRQQAQVSAAAEAVSAAVGARLPTVVVSGGWAVTEVDSPLSHSRGDQWDVTVSVNVPLYAGGALTAKEAQARIQYQNQVAAARQVEEEERAAIMQQVELVRTQELVSRATTLGVFAARNAAAVALGRYKAGVGSLEEVTQTQAQLRSLMLEELTAKTELIAKTLGLLRLQGRIASVLKDGKC